MIRNGAGIRAPRRLGGLSSIPIIRKGLRSSIENLESPVRSARESRDPESLPRFADAGRRPPVFTGGHPCQGNELPPAKRRARRGELLGDSPVVLLGVDARLH